MKKIKFSIITLFPEAIQPYLNSSMLYKAQDRQILSIQLINLRDFGLGPHKSVDDTPYGGGDGMLLRCEPVFAAIESVKALDPEAEVILPTPVGLTWNQALARQFAGVDGFNYDIHELANVSVEDQTRKNAPESAQEGARVASSFAPDTDDSHVGINALEPPRAPKIPKIGQILAQGEDFGANRLDIPSSDKEPAETAENNDSRHYIILCPHYEGYDERILTLVDYKISIGDYVLTGGELAALIIIDSVTRLLPGVLGGDHSALVESFSAGNNLEYPQYTRPEEFRGMKVPNILLSGNHAKIAAWRARHSGQKGG